MIKSIFIKTEEEKTILTLGGAEEIRCKGAVLFITSIKTGAWHEFPFSTAEAADSALNQIADWLAGDTAQLVLEPELF